MEEIERAVLRERPVPGEHRQPDEHVAGIVGRGRFPPDAGDPYDGGAGDHAGDREQGGPAGDRAPKALAGGCATRAAWSDRRRLALRPRTYDPGLHLLRLSRVMVGAVSRPLERAIDRRRESSAAVRANVTLPHGQG